MVSSICWRVNRFQYRHAKRSMLILGKNSKRSMVMAKFVLVCISLLVLTACWPVKEKPIDWIEEAFPVSGYKTHEYPSSRSSVNRVFALTKNANGKPVLMHVCDKLYEDIAISTDDIAVNSVDLEKSFDAGLTANFLSKLIGEANDLEAGLKRNQVKTVAVKINGPKLDYIVESQIYNEDGNRRAISAQCWGPLRDRKKAGTLKDVYVVGSEMYASSVEVELKKVAKTEGGASVSWNNIIDLKPELKATTNSRNALVIDKQMYLRYVPYQIEEFVDTGLMGGRIAVVKAKVADLPEGVTIEE